MVGDDTVAGEFARERVPSEAQRGAVKARAAALCRDLERYQYPERKVQRSRPRVLVWCLVLIALLGTARPTTARASGPVARLLRGAATVGGHRLSHPGDVARTTPGDVLTVAPDGRVELDLGTGRVALLGGGRLLVEGQGPSSLRLLSGEADALGPLVLHTLAGTLRVPLGIEVEVRLGDPRPPTTGATPLVFVTDGPGAELVNAQGVQRLP